MGIFESIARLFSTSTSSGTTLTRLQRTLHYTFNNPELLRTAVTHSSSPETPSDQRLTFDRLEFLGDAVLQLVVTDKLFQHYPKKNEGVLTRRRSDIVNQYSLAEIANNLNLVDYIKCQQGMNPAENPSVLSDVTEAIIGALYLDGGIDPARRFILGAISSGFNSSKIRTPANYKGALIEYCQNHNLPEPQFVVVNSGGPDHSKMYTVVVKLAKEELGTGKDSSKKKAGQRAARAALDQLQVNK